MPSFYAHNRFGKEVCKELPKEIHQIIQEYPSAYKAGLQGPDFLFFYRPFLPCHVNTLGHAQHKQSFLPFLETVRSSIRKKGRHCPEYAYLLGFICHFMLDSEAHTYVNEKAKEKGFNHLVMEMEFDRYLMKKDGIQPFLYPLWRHIRWDKQTLQAVYGVYRHFDLTPRDVKKSLQSMAFYKWLVTTGKTLRRLILRSLMFLSLHYRKLEGHMMDLIPKASAKETNPVLSKIYQSTLAPCRDIIIDFDKTFLNGKPLNPRFQTTFQKRE